MNEEERIDQSTFRRLLGHLIVKEVQNIDLMNLASFVVIVYPSGTAQRQKREVMK